MPSRRRNNPICSGVQTQGDDYEVRSAVAARCADSAFDHWLSSLSLTLISSLIWSPRQPGAATIVMPPKAPKKPRNPEPSRDLPKPNSVGLVNRWRKSSKPESHSSVLTSMSRDLSVKRLAWRPACRSCLAYILMVFMVPSSGGVCVAAAFSILAA